MSAAHRPGSARIAVAQVDTHLGDVEANLDLIESQVERATAEEADVLVLPELALSGYGVGASFHDHAVTVDGPEMDRLRDLSRRIDLVAGFIEETSDALFFNSGAYLAEGEIVHLHRKIYPPTYGPFEERRWFGAGTLLSAFETRIGRAGLLICGDAWHLPLAYLLAHDGADVIFVLAAASNHSLGLDISSHDCWRRICQTYGLTLTCFVVFANRVGKEGDLAFYGLSSIVKPDGEILCEAPEDESHLLTGDLDMKLLRKQRIALPFRRDDSLGLTNRLGREILGEKLRRRDAPGRNGGRDD